jgi:hypothetical protein
LSFVPAPFPSPREWKMSDQTFVSGNILYRSPISPSSCLASGIL